MKETINHKPNRILYIQSPTGGGSTVSLYELVKGLDTSSYEPVVLFLQKNKYLSNFNKLGIRILTLATPKSEKKRQITSSILGKVYQLIMIDLLLALRIAQIIKKEKIDIVHQNHAFERAAMIASCITKTPQVCHFRLFGNKISSSIKWLISSVDAFLYISNDIAKNYHNLGIPSNKGYIIYNPFDKKIFQQVRVNEIDNLRIEFGLKKNDCLISNIGRLDSWKGQEYFLKSFAEIFKKHPNTKALIVGDHATTPKGLRYYEYLQNLAKELNISKHVIFTGHRFDIPQIMVASNIVIHSASEPEPFGRVIVEAMLAGSPVIATAAGGVPEIIEDQITGILIPLRNVESMANAIQKLLENPVKSKKMAKVALEYAQDKFSVQRHVRAIENVYQTILTK